MLFCLITEGARVYFAVSAVASGAVFDAAGSSGVGNGNFCLC